MEKKYDHKNIEKNKNKKWMNNQYFSSHNINKKKFTIILPPPNITGKLHIGHAWNSYIQDAIIRYKKICNFDVMWIPGMDHAGIATQAKIEEIINKNGITKYQLGRKKFIDKIWQWKKEYAKIIRKQWFKLGLALDYSNEKFTLDKELSKNVSQIFINLYNRNLIFRGKRNVNFDVKLKTVLSNIEVENKKIKQKMYYIKYDLENNGFVVVATTRPETLFSDGALAINPKKNKKLIGMVAIHPLNKKKLPILSDESIEIKKGTGIMKVSAHAKKDIEILNKNKIKIIESINDDGTLNKNAMEFEGMERFCARKAIIKKLKKQNRIIKIKETISVVGYSQRSNSIIEILIKPQWFIKMNYMSKIILENMKKNEMKFFPSRFFDVLKKWIENTHDWCISRQLWWGHRIPVWYKNDKIKVQENSPGNEWIQDEDVLDTWFSSGLAPFLFLEWPKNKEKLKKYYPIDLIVTGYDIIFFWIARMYFQSLDIMKNKPFKNVLIHGLVRDENGKKMSKSLNNGIDPMEIIEKYGSDSLRWFLLTNSSPGKDISYSTKKIKASWNLNNKLWNISRYIIKMMKHQTNELTEADVWINNKLFNLKKFINKKIDEYNFTIIGKKIYKFIIDDFSSWYIEISKINSNQKFAKIILKNLMIIIHPFLPFITDHIFYLIDKKELLEAKNMNLIKIKTNNNILRTIEIIKLIRNFRYKKNILNKKIIQYYPNFKLKQYEINIINKLTNGHIEKNNDALIVYGKLQIFIKLSHMKKNEEKNRYKKEITRLKNEINRSKTILNNKGFLKKAPENKIQEEKEKFLKYKKELYNFLNKKL